MSLAILSLRLAEERDVLLARQRSRSLAALLGFENQDQVRIATAVSEVARHAFGAGDGGAVEFFLEGRSAPQLFSVRVVGALDEPGTQEGSLDPSAPAPGRAAGLAGARRLMDAFEVERSSHASAFVLRKLLPAQSRVFAAPDVELVRAQLMHETLADPIGELQRQNQELLGTLDELRRRQAELVELNHELEDTNRGVVALYAELDDRSMHLQRADDLKRRFLSNMSHEFRTPLHSVVALARLLFERVDGPLSAEQEKQVRYIDQSARALLDLVDDLLDIAKVEAGRVDVRPVEFDVADVFGALRGMLRPLLINDRLQLVFEEAPAHLRLFTDEGKVSQILRNLIANALKFTPSGEVRVSAALASGDDGVERAIFRVTDTGIGIAREDLGRIFEEFEQVDGPVQRGVRGTGLGLPLSRKLATLLGGTLTVSSAVDIGSTFTLTVPSRFEVEDRGIETAPFELDDSRPPVLLVEDDPVDRLLVEKHLRSTPFQVVSAQNLREARRWMTRFVPSAFLLDVELRGEDSWAFLAEIKRDPATRHCLVILVTRSDDEPKARSLGADAFLQKPFGADELVRELSRCLPVLRNAHGDS